ncbi:flavin reductase (NADPH)-like [Panulirus ornatus]|uniref:flavin reductase (NADPH)-like n=1 Tax=Panulirus ornatus TaxID=150431 RepID=UPI003A8B6C71
MKLAVLGASGQTGQQFVQQALDAGHSVTAIVRNPTKITVTHDNLAVVEGNIFDESSLSPIISNHDAVVSCLGFPRNPQPVTGYTESASAIIGAMRKESVSRFVTMTSWYTETSVASSMGFLLNWVVVPFLKPVLTNMRQMEQYLEESCPDIDYTVVRPPGLGNGPTTGKPMTVAEDYVVGTGSSFNRVHRSDVASFMLSCLHSNQYDRKMVAVASNK